MPIDRGNAPVEARVSHVGLSVSIHVGFRLAPFAFVALAALGCRTEQREEKKPIVAPARASAPASTLPPAPASNSVTPAPSASVDAVPPRLLELFDRGKAERAMVAYRKFLTKLCAALDAGPVTERLEAVGLDAGADFLFLCEAGSVAPFASGSFLEAGADEVLLDVASGLDGAAGNRTLAVLRADASGYRLVRHVLRSKHLTAHARVAGPGGRDALFICDGHGNMGLYPEDCGIFRERLDLGLVGVTACGRASSVSLGKIQATEQGLSVEVVIEEFTRTPSGPDEAPNGFYCSKRALERKQAYPIAYAWKSDRMARITPIPKRVTNVLALEGAPIEGARDARAPAR